VIDEEPPPALLRPWFEDLEKQAYASRIGMWLFLASEVLLFGGLFGLYGAYRLQYARDFFQASHHNDAVLGTVNTVVLVTSSFTVAWALHLHRSGRTRSAARCIALTVLLGAAFLGIKTVEYARHIAEGVLPGADYAFAELPAPGARLFFTLYYLMTGLHGLHVIGGMTALSIIGWRLARGRVSALHPTLLENGALYWHLVDAVWIVLWPLLYLTG
jgi:cytochrome c oxidase subunit III